MKRKNYGIALKKAIEKNGLKKKNIFERLGMSKPTFNKRLADGEFTDAQLMEVKKIIETKF